MTEKSSLAYFVPFQYIVLIISPTFCESWVTTGRKRMASETLDKVLSNDQSEKEFTFGEDGAQNDGRKYL